jgi:hypothetical protein
MKNRFLFCSIILIVALLFTSINVFALKEDTIIGKTPNGTLVTLEQAKQIQTKLDERMVNAYTREISFSKFDKMRDLKNLTSVISNANYLSDMQKVLLLEALNNDDFISITAKTYFVTTDEYGITMPITNEEFSQTNKWIDGDVSINSSQSYTGVTIYATVEDNGSTQSVRKYKMDGNAIFTAIFNNTNHLNDGLGVAWAGGEAIDSDQGGAYYYTEDFLDTRYMQWVSGHRAETSNNESQNYKYNGWWYYCPPASFNTRVYVSQVGEPTAYWNMTATWVHTWLTYDYSFSFGSGGGSMSASPSTGTLPYTCTTTYGL